MLVNRVHHVAYRCLDAKQTARILASSASLWTSIRCMLECAVATSGRVDFIDLSPFIFGMSFSMRRT